MKEIEKMNYRLPRHRTRVTVDEDAVLTVEAIEDIGLIRQDSIVLSDKLPSNLLRSRLLGDTLRYLRHHLMADVRRFDRVLHAWHSLSRALAFLSDDTSNFTALAIKDGDLDP